MSVDILLPESDTASAIEFLEAISPGRWDLAAINPDGGRPEFMTFRPTDATAAEDWIDARQGEAGLYYQVNEVRPGLLHRKATKADIARVRHLHADIDQSDDATLQRIRSFAPSPSIIVFFRGRLPAAVDPARALDRIRSR